MPANLTADYLEAERDYKSAATQAEKVAGLERMLATLPKHKGTEKMQADIKRRLSQARKEAQKKGGHACRAVLSGGEGRRGAGGAGRSAQLRQVATGLRR